MSFTQENEDGQDGRLISINLDDTVRVRLSEFGRAVFGVEFCHRSSSLDPVIALAQRERNDRMHEFTVRDLMAYFGSCMPGESESSPFVSPIILVLM